MRYLSYVEYQLSKITWFGTVPKSWQIKRLRFATKGIEQGWSPQCDNKMAEDDAWGVRKVGCVNGNQFDSMENKALPQELEPKPEYELRPRDILIGRANTTELSGSAAIVQNKTTCVPDFYFVTGYSASV